MRSRIVIPWGATKREDLAMSEKNYILISAVLFGLVGFLHLVRLLTHSSIQIGTMMFPIWGSWLALLISVLLLVWAFRLLSHWQRTSLPHG